jgi:hypothetical protein
MIQIVRIFVHTIVIGKGGPKLEKAAIEEIGWAAQPTNPLDPTTCHLFLGGMPTGLDGQSVDIADSAKSLSTFFGPRHHR